MGKQAAGDVDPTFAPVVDAFSRHRDVVRKRMFSSSNVLTVNGKIFAMLVKGELVAKLSKARVDEMVGAGRGRNFDAGRGRVMKEWVTVPPRGVDWIDLAKEAYALARR